MRLIRRSFLVTCCLAVAWAWGAPAAIVSDEPTGDQYDCELQVRTAVDATSGPGVVLDLDYTGSESTQVILSTQGVTVISDSPLGQTPRGDTQYALPVGTSYTLLLMRRGSWLGVAYGNIFLFRGDFPRPNGNQVGVTVGQSWLVESVDVVRLEPVRFADDFMRTKDEPGAWTVQSGNWGLQTAWDEDPVASANRFDHVAQAQNPFSWLGCQTGNTGALCTTGPQNWGNYSFTVAIRPPEVGAVGVAVNVASKDNYLLIRWAPACDHSATGDRLSLIRVVNGVPIPVADDRGGYLPGQWYALTVTSDMGNVTVTVDGCQRLTQNSLTPFRGGVGLYVEGTEGGLFDDVTVYGRTLDTDLILESQRVRINQRFLSDMQGMAEWTAPPDWVMMPGGASMKYYRLDTYGDQWITATVSPAQIRPGVLPLFDRLSLTLFGDGANQQSGYQATIEPKGTSTYLFNLYRETTLLASATGPAFPQGESTTVRLRKDTAVTGGARLRVLINGDPVLEALDPTPLTGTHPAYYAGGIFASSFSKPGSEPTVLGANIIDDTFSNAPVDWLTQGTWMPSVRWACSADWSFFSGWSRGTPVLWRKQRIMGDQYFETFVGPKMEYPRELDVYEKRYRDFSISICTDGHDPRSGYAGIFGAPSENGTPNQRTVLMRNGVIVKSCSLVSPQRDIAHRGWFHLALVLRGNTVEFWVEGNLALSYTDPDPLEGGVPCIWSTNNGISVARARLQCAQTPIPRTDTQVYVGRTSLPEWENIGQVFALDFPHTCATDGLPVTLSVAQLEPKVTTPPPTAPTCAVLGNHVTFTPTQVGPYWFQVTGAEGAALSPPTEVDMPFFNPALGRDDSHALVLYRFTEGQGSVVNDLGHSGAPLNLTVPATGTSWIPGQGLHVDGTATLRSAAGADKLLTIAKTRTATLEMWFSPDTIYPPPSGQWKASVVRWGVPNGRTNLMMAHIRSTSLFCPGDTSIAEGGPNLSGGFGFLSSLHHWVVTWDGRTTRDYLDGTLLSSNLAQWMPDRWMANAPLLLGTYDGSSQAFYGTFYLLAIHDRCLSDTEVLKNYQAGPSAK